MTDPAPLLEVRDLVKRFPGPRWSEWIWAVNGVSLLVSAGETLGLVGESGSGKTTVGRCLLRLLEPTEGTILLDGVEITRLRQKELRPLRKRMQIVFQEPYDSLDPRRSLGDAISAPLGLDPTLSGVERVEKVEAVADLVGVPAAALGRFPHEMSAGLLQRAGVARAMVCDPDLVVLDEPTSLLDATTRAEIISLLQEVQQRTGVAYLFISHDLATVEHISHRVAVMYLGQIVESGSKTAIFNQPIHPYTRSLLSAVLYPDPDRRQEPTPLVGEIPSPINLPSGCFLHQRCPVAIEACSSVVPQLVDIDQGHQVSCIRLGPLDHQVVERGQRIDWAEKRGFEYRTAGNGLSKGGLSADDGK